MSPRLPYWEKEKRASRLAFCPIDFGNLSLTRDAAVEIHVFDVTGRSVRTMELGQVGVGSRSMRFDGTGDDGKPLPSGVYFYRVSANGTTVTRKMVIAR